MLAQPRWLLSARRQQLRRRTPVRLPGAAATRSGAVPDFGDGGAYPDVHVIQYPLQMGAGKLGPGGIAPRLDVNYAELQVRKQSTSPAPDALRRC